MNIEFMKYVKYVLRRSWIVLIIAALLGGVTFGYFYTRDPIYTAEARIFVGNTLFTPDPNISQLDFGRRIAPSYAELVTRPPVLQATIDGLNLNMSTQRLARMVSARIILDTPILAIRVTTDEPALAADIANELARNLIATSPGLLEEEQQQLSELSQQISQLREQIARTTDQTNAVLSELNNAIERGNQREVEILQDRYNRLVDQQNSARAVLAQLSNTVTQLTNRANRLQLIEEAIPPTSSANPNPYLFAAIAAAAGAGVAVAGILLFLEYFDDRLRTENEVRRQLDMRVLGKVPLHIRTSRDHSQLLGKGDFAHEPLGEAYRTIQTSLLFSTEGRQSGVTYMIVSPREKEGRSFTAANLAVIMAESGLNVLLIDADLRNPRLHKLFRLENKKGLASLLETTLTGAPELEKAWHEAIQQSASERLHIVTSGLDGVKLNSKILGYDNLQACLSNLHTWSDYDVILFDTPPAFNLADSYILATATQANVILVLQASRTSKQEASKTIEQFQHIKSTVNGVIINKA